MQVNKSKFYTNVLFKPGEIKEAITSVMSDLNVPNDDINISIEYSCADGASISKDINIDDLFLVTDFDNSVMKLHCLFKSKIEHMSNNIMMMRFHDGIVLAVSVDDLISYEFIINTLEKNLNLIEYNRSIQYSAEYSELESRIKIIEDKLLEPCKQLSCFVSYRFNNETKPIVLELSRFLTLLNINVVTGMGYEPRKITDKVSDRLKSGHDFLIYLISRDGESTWTRDELIMSASSGMPIVVLIEKGSCFEKGILGDLEYVEFESGHIGDTFISILEAISFLRRLSSCGTTKVLAT